MTSTLRDLEIQWVSLVKNGADTSARIKLTKAIDPSTTQSRIDELTDLIARFKSDAKVLTTKTAEAPEALPRTESQMAKIAAPTPIKNPTKIEGGAAAGDDSYFSAILEVPASRYYSYNGA